MELNIKEKIEELVEKIQGNPALLAQFQKEPVAAVEELIGIPLPHEQLEKLVEGIKAKITLDKVGEALGGLSSLLGKK